MRFEFATANRIVFGAGVARDMGDHAAMMGQRALVVIGFNADRARPLLDSLAAKGIETHLFSVTGEPTVALALAGAEQAKTRRCDMVTAIGGGSAIDTGKAVAALATNPGDPFDYLEVIGKGHPIIQMPLPMIAVPTTAGTGSEVTRNAVLASPENRVKVSMRSPLMLPRLALVDPELTYSLPPHVTAATGMDALTQVIEPYVSNGATPITDALCADGIRRAARSLQRAFTHPDDADAREDMALTSLFGGFGLANAKLGAVHGFAGPIGGMYDAPHGAVCAALLPHVMEANIHALRRSDSPVLRRFDDIARWLTGRESASALDGVAWVRDLCAALNIPPLRTYGITKDHFPAIVEKSARASSMKGNPVTLAAEELTAVLEKAL